MHIFYSSVRVDCGDPGTLANGIKVGSNYTLGQLVHYHCDRGYLIRGSMTIRCHTSGRWTSSAPTCYGK